VAQGQNLTTYIPNLFLVNPGGNTSFGAAYTQCTGSSSPVYNTCEVWDCNLAKTGETMMMSPWNFDGTETPVHLRFCPGVVTVYGPLIVPRNSVIEGAGRSAGAGNNGTVIQAVSPAVAAFGGVGYIAINSGGTSCTGGSGSVSWSGGTGSGASATYTTAGGNLAITMVNPGGGYGTSQAGAPVPSVVVTGCSPSLTAVLSGSVVIIGDTNENPANAVFGSRLMNLTVDCNQVANCTAVEIQNTQEQCGPVFVSAINYTSRCLWVHGMVKAIGTDNSSAFDMECNGNTSTTPNPGMSPSTVPVEFDNTKSRGIIQATINPVNSITPIGLRTGTTGSNEAITCSGGVGTVTLPGTTALPANWSNTPPYSLNAYVTIAGITGGTVWNNTWPINSIHISPGSFNIVGGICPIVGTGPTATATLEPSADIIVCSGSSCAYGAEGNTLNNPTEVSLIQVHMEHAGTGVFATGSNTSVNMVAPTTTVGGNSMYASVTIDGTSPPASVNISSLLVNSGLQYMIVDGITGTNLAVQGSGGTLANYVSGTNILPQSLLARPGWAAAAGHCDSSDVADPGNRHRKQ
jgi:hypothetical protein